MLPKKELLRISLFSLLSATSGVVSGESLSEIYRLALENDPEIASAEATYKAGDTIRSQALAELLPTITASYSWSDQSSSSFVLPGSTDDGSFINEDYSVSLNQNLFNLQAIFGYKQALSTAEQALLTYGSAQQELIVRTAEAYFDVLRGEDNLTSVLAEERAIARQLEQTQQRYEVGLIAITDVHEAQAAYDLIIAEKLSLESALGIARESLAQITGEYISDLSRLTEDYEATAPEPADVNAWVSFAEENNLSIRLAEQQLRASQQNSNVKNSAFAPTVSGFAEYSNSKTGQASREDTEVDSYGVRVNWELFRGGAKWAERKQAGYEKVAAQSDLVAAKRQVLRDTRSAYLETNTAAARVKARGRAIISSQSALDATQAGYDAGTRNIVDLLNAQQVLYGAQRDYANSRYDYIINSLRLKQAAGTITAKDLETIPLESAASPVVATD